MSNRKQLLKWQSNSLYYYLFASLGLFLVLPPFLIHFQYLSYLIYFLVSVVVVNCVLILFNNSSLAGYCLLALATSLLFIWLTIFVNWQNTLLQVVRMAIMAAFFLSAFLKMMKEIFLLKQVNSRIIIGAVGAYLLLGLVGSMLLEIVELIYPNSFSHNNLYTDFYSLIYISFVTLTTLGFGDITPMTAQGPGRRNHHCYLGPVIPYYSYGDAGWQVFERCKVA